jgi:YggT family protein
MLLGIPYGHGLIYGIIIYGIGILLIAMIIRMIASWVRIDERYAFIRVLAKITDPFITPIRRFVPPIGVLDISFILAFFLLITLQVLLAQALPPGW